MGVLDIWLEIAEIGEQKTELGRGEDWNIEEIRIIASKEGS